MISRVLLCSWWSSRAAPDPSIINKCLWSLCCCCVCTDRQRIRIALFRRREGNTTSPGFLCDRHEARTQHPGHSENPKWTSSAFCVLVIYYLLELFWLFKCRCIESPKWRETDLNTEKCSYQETNRTGITEPAATSLQSERLNLLSLGQKAALKHTTQTRSELTLRNSHNTNNTSSTWISSGFFPLWTKHWSTLFNNKTDN